jgi:hypothetical protein
MVRAKLKAAEILFEGGRCIRKTADIFAKWPVFSSDAVSVQTFCIQSGWYYLKATGNKRPVFSEMIV